MPTFSVRPSRFSKLKLLGDGRSAQSRESRPLLAQMGPVSPVCEASVQEPLSESLDAELSISFKF